MENTQKQFPLITLHVIQHCSASLLLLVESPQTIQSDPWENMMAPLTDDSC